jgi:hypothetical protein
MGVVSMVKAKTKKRTEYITMTIVSDTGKGNKSIRLPKMLIKILLGLASIFVIYTIIITLATTGLKNTYRSKLQQIKELEAISERQKIETADLTKITEEVRVKLEALQAIEARVKELVGISN